MKKAIYGIMAVLFLVGILEMAHASLIDMGGGVIKDDVTGLYWYQNLDEFTMRTYDEQLSDIAALDHAGGGAWHMATEAEMERLWSYAAQDIATNFDRTDAGGGYYSWVGRYDEPTNNSVHPQHYVGMIRQYSDGSYEKFDLTWIDEDCIENEYLGAWVVTDSNPVVPIPGAVWLLGSGLVGLVGLRRKVGKEQ